MNSGKSISVLGTVALILKTSAGAAYSEPTEKVRNVIFDLGGVIVDLNNTEMRRRMERIVGAFDNPKLQQTLESYQRGEIDLPGFRSALRTLSRNPKLSDRQIDRAWGAQIGRVACSKLKLVQRLRRKGFKTFVLSTTDPLHARLITRRLRRCLPGVRGDPFAHLFDKTYFTFKLGLRKPDQRIYRKVLADAGLKGNETLFIDDSIRNVLGAQRAGLLSLVIRGNGYLRWLPELLGVQ